MFPSKDNLTICFAHAAYQMQARFEQRKTGIIALQIHSGGPTEVRFKNIVLRSVPHE